MSERSSERTPAGDVPPATGAPPPRRGYIPPAPAATAALQHPALRRLGVDVQGRVDDYLLRVDQELARRAATAAQRREAGVAVRNRIYEKLAARLGAAAKAAGAGEAQLHAADADAVLAELGPPQKQAAEHLPVKQAPHRYTGPKKLAKLALLGLCWAMMFPVMIGLSRVPLPDVSPDLPPPWWYTLLQVVIIPLGWSALLAPTVLGLIAIDQIRKSNGRMYGMSLALFVAALYPLLALNWGVFWICWQVAGALLAKQAIGEPMAKLITQVLPTVVCVLGDYFIVARAWMALSESE